MPKFLFLLLLFFITSLPGFTQEETVQPLNQYSGKVIIRGAPSAPAPTPVPDSASAPAVDPAASPQVLNEDVDVNELENDRLELLEKTKGIEAVVKPITEPLNPMEEIQKLGYQQIGPASLLDPKVLAIVQKTFKEGPLSKMSEAEVRTMILEKSKGKMFEGFLKDSPKILNFIVNLMRDKDALMGLLGILVRKDDLKTYMYISIGIFLFGMFLKRRIIKPKFSAFKRFCYSITVSLILTSITFYIFYSFFGQELGPTLSVISKSF